MDCKTTSMEELAAELSYVDPTMVDVISKVMTSTRVIYLTSSEEMSSSEIIVNNNDELYNNYIYQDSHNKCLIFFAEKGDLKNVKIAIENGADHWVALLLQHSC